MILVAAAALSAAGIWWRMGRPDQGPRASDRRTFGFGDPAESAGGDFFVFQPTETPAVHDDRPPPALSLARLALAIAVSTVILVAAASAIGLILKLELDRYFMSGG